MGEGTLVCSGEMGFGLWGRGTVLKVFLCWGQSVEGTLHPFPSLGGWRSLPGHNYRAHRSSSRCTRRAMLECQFHLLTIISASS